MVYERSSVRGFGVLGISPESYSTQKYWFINAQTQYVLWPAIRRGTGYKYHMAAYCPIHRVLKAEFNEHGMPIPEQTSADQLAIQDTLVPRYLGIPMFESLVVVNCFEGAPPRKYAELCDGCMSCVATI